MSTDSTRFTADEIAIRAGKAASDPLRRELLVLLRTRPMIDATQTTLLLKGPHGHMLFHLRALIELGAVEQHGPVPVREANPAQLVCSLDHSSGVADAALALIDQLADSEPPDRGRLDLLDGIVRWARPRQNAARRWGRRRQAARRRRPSRRRPRARWVRITVAREGSPGELTFLRERTDTRRWSISIVQRCAGHLTQIELARVLARYVIAYD